MPIINIVSFLAVAFWPVTLIALQVTLLADWWGRRFLLASWPAFLFLDLYGIAVGVCEYSLYEKEKLFALVLVHTLYGVLLYAVTLWVFINRKRPDLTE